tara:strand:+ start:4214 stop:4429 length:216 start_codon:yes stop_codon:yes gene_type:complete
VTFAGFDSIEHHSMMWVHYNNKRYYVISLSFSERLFALVESRDHYPADEWKWVRCENVELIECKTLQFPKK